MNMFNKDQIIFQSYPSKFFGDILKCMNFCASIQTPRFQILPFFHLSMNLQVWIIYGPENTLGDSYG